MSNLGLASQNLAAEVKIRVERGGGKLLKADPNLGRGKTLTLRVLGLDKHDSSRWQAIAGIPQDDFERHIEETIANRRHD